MNKIDAAYIAGFIDADGCVQLPSGKTNYPNKLKAQYTFTPRVEITNASNHVLEWIATITGFDNKIIKFYLPKGRQKNPYYRMYFTGSNLRKLLPEIEPHLKIKQQQARYLLEINKLFDDVAATGGNFRLRSEVHQNNLGKYILIWYKVAVLNNGIDKAGELLLRKFNKKPEELLGHPNV